MTMPEMKWETGKRDHKALSDAAAPIYDQLYAKFNEATRAYMDKEEEILKEVAANSANLSVALDLGRFRYQPAHAMRRST